MWGRNLKPLVSVRALGLASNSVVLVVALCDAPTDFLNDNPLHWSQHLRHHQKARAGDQYPVVASKVEAGLDKAAQTKDRHRHHLQGLTGSNRKAAEFQVGQILA